MNLLDTIKKAGIVGAGGAGFPTHIKLNCKVEYFIVNGLECEPLLQSDKFVMRNNSDAIVKGAEEIGKVIGAKHIIIGLKSEYYKEIDALEKSISKLKSKIKIHKSTAFYPAGDEQVLVYEITGRTIPPGGIPLNVGAVVSNSSTVFNVFEAIKGNPVTYKFVTVLGEVYNQSILKVPIGTTVKECIKNCGGNIIEDYEIVMGGPMMGKKISKNQIDNRVITKIDGGIIVIPKEHYLVEKENVTIEHIINQAKSTCIQCRTCTDLCPRNLIGHPIEPHKIMRSVALGDKNNEAIKQSLICCECGICEIYACPMMLSPKQLNIYLKNRLREHGVKWEGQDEIHDVEILRHYRKVPTNRLISRLQLDKYKKVIVKEGVEINPSEVKIPLKQGIGVAAEPIIKIGDMVKKGQIIGEIKEGKMGTFVHASIDGIVSDINENITIKAI